MQSAEMPEITSELVEQEMMMWHGQPIRGGTTNPQQRLGIIIGILFTVPMLFVLASIVPEFFSLSQESGGFNDPSFFFLTYGYLALILIFVLGIPILFIGWLRANRIRSRNTHYAITNRRIIILTTGKLQLVQSFSGSGITFMMRQERRDGSGNLYWNKFVTTTSTTTSNRTLTGSGVFVNIPQVREVEHILQKLIQQQPG